MKSVESTKNKTFNLYFFIFISVMIGCRLEAKTILDIQPYLQVSEGSYGQGEEQIGVKLYNLNENVENWYLLEIDWSEDSPKKFYHLENPYPDRQYVRLLGQDRPGIDIISFAQRTPCLLWQSKISSPIEKASHSSVPFVPLCAGRLLIRNVTHGHISSKELAVHFFRRHLWQGENLINLLKGSVFKDHRIINARMIQRKADQSLPGISENYGAPIPAFIDEAYRSSDIDGEPFGITYRSDKKKRLQVGVWYPTRFSSDIFVSAIKPKVLPQSLKDSYKKRVLAFDGIEDEATVFLVAFDLNQFRIGYSVGTEHPHLGYSERASPDQRTEGWSGPDGIDEWKPLVSTGLMNPMEVDRVVASFTGGFKRKHSVFRWGKLSQSSGGSHYGFMQGGVIFSKLHLGLATAVMYRDGRFALKTWDEYDQRNLHQVHSARQNGVPLVQYHAKTSRSFPSLYVKNNALGNWSGTKDQEVRSLRSGLCWQKTETKNFLIYGYFSSHTPNAMAKVFLAYKCRYAMHLDMNMIHHTYLGIYRHRGSEGEVEVEHIIKEMGRRDNVVDGKVLPRFVGLPDVRDFFYLTRKPTRAEHFLVERPTNVEKKLKLQQFKKERKEKHERVFSDISEYFNLW